METEIWKDVSGFAGKIQVSSFGRVKSLYREPKIMSQSLLSNNKRVERYCRVGIWDGESQKDYLVHRLVAEAFIPNPENKPEVNHIDGDKTNNNVSNLEWNTRSENQRHSQRVLKHMNGRAKLKTLEVRQEIRRRVKEGEVQTRLAQEYGVGVDAIHRLISGRSWTNDPV